jgi:prepilin signal peptidase PulO-like enzyme (type II secretory pathway)
MAGATLGGEAAVAAAVLGLAFLLFVQDLAWRWLPLEWSLPLLVLGLIAGILGERGGDALAGAALGAGLLWALQAVFRIWRGVEALGTGDIWLAAAIGSFCGPAAVALTLGLAALSGLAFASLQLSIAKAPGHNRWGVAYGSHLIAVFILFHSAPFQLLLMIATVAVVVQRYGLFRARKE